MDPFKTINKLSISSILFGVITLILGWLATAAGNPFIRLQLGEASLVFLNLFFYSLLSDRISGIEKSMKILSGMKKEAKAKLVP